MRARPALAALILAAACGTTVPAGQQGSPAQGGLAASAPAQAGGLGPAASPAVTNAAGQPAAPGTSGGDSSSVTGGATTTGGAQAAAPGSSGALAPIEVGIGVDGNQGAFAAAFG